MKNKYRLPETSTQEQLEMNWSTVIKYGDFVLISGYFYQGAGKDSHIAAIYRFTTADRDVEAPIRLEKVSEEFFSDAGHAIAWGIGNAKR